MKNMADGFGCPLFLCKKGAVKKRAIKKTATTLKRVGKQSFLWYNKFDEKIPTRI